jgi:transposase-like protein
MVLIDKHLYMNVIQVFQKFPTQESCLAHLEKLRWDNKPVCPYCKATITSKFKSTRYYNCSHCNNGFSVTVNTIFHDTKVPLQKWFLAITLILNAKKGISGLQLQRDLEIGSYKTAWRMLRLIRTAMIDTENNLYYKAIIEIDETYVGGKPRKMVTKEHIKRGRGTKKTPVVGIIDRDEKHVFAKVMLPNQEGKKLTGKQLLSVVEEVCTDKDTVTIMTDEFTGYNILKHKGYNHQRVDHTKEYAIGNIHTNTIESFWAILKRGVYGVYHSISVKYMQNYINEFCFRYNYREASLSFGMVLDRGLTIKAQPITPDVQKSINETESADEVKSVNLRWLF